MSRTLNPELFGSTGGAPLVKVDGAPLQQRRLSEIDSQIEALNQKLDRWAQVMEQRMQQLHSGQKSTVEQIRQIADGFSASLATVHSKLNERRAADAKTQELIERHNQLVNTFETRIQHVQKVATEQEIKLMTYQSTYDEVLREIRNLRKR